MSFVDLLTKQTHVIILRQNGMYLLSRRNKTHASRWLNWQTHKQRKFTKQRTSDFPREIQTLESLGKLEKAVEAVAWGSSSRNSILVLSNLHFCFNESVKTYTRNVFYSLNNVHIRNVVVWSTKYGRRKGKIRAPNFWRLITRLTQSSFLSTQLLKIAGFCFR